MIIKKEAEEEQEYLDVYKRIPKIEPSNDEIFIANGTFYYFKNFKELDVIMKKDYTKSVYIDYRGSLTYWGNGFKEYFVEGWYFLEYVSNYDERDTTKLITPNALKKEIEKTKKIFSKLEEYEK